MQAFYQKYGKNHKYSQNGEEGILIECLKRMEIVTGNCVEFGAHNGEYCSNTMLLIDSGWKGIMIEADVRLFHQLSKNTRGKDVSCFDNSVNQSNVNDYVSMATNVLSIDTDGDNDYDCFYALEHKPAIVIIEINSGIAPDVKGNKSGYYDMVELARAKGYFLLCHTGNLVFVRTYFRHLFPEIIGDGLTNSELYFNKSWLKH